MVDDKYRHTFHLISGEILVTYSPSKELAHVTFGKETAFFASNDDYSYTIPFFSVGYVDTEEI
jgi:hypothetical protein